MEKSEIAENIEKLKEQFFALNKNFDRKNLVDTIKELENKTLQPDFWDHPQNASQTSQELSQLQTKKKNWEDLEFLVEYFEDLKIETKNFSNIPDSDLEPLFSEISDFQEKIKQQEHQQYLNDPYDNHAVVLTIHTGNGGQDAEDFSSKLLRMYLRFAEKKGCKTKILEISESDVGLKSATLFVSGSMVYGNLKGEHGIHRLIRLSPFNAKSLRQTSFARVEILPKIEQDEALDIEDKDLRVDVFRSSGAGGQSVNTTDSAVRITYLPLNLVATCQNERSQQQNKAHALAILKSRILKLKLEQNASEIAAIRGEFMENSFGSQIRTYTLHPYKMVKDHRTLYESAHPEKVFDGDLDGFIEAFLQNL